MPTLDQDLRAIRQAVYGREVREVIADAIEKVIKATEDGVPIDFSIGDYEALKNKPKIDGVELIGNLSLMDFKYMSEDTAAGWNSKPTYVPKKGEIVIYTDGDGNRNFPEIKIGDGSAYVADLPFVGSGLFYLVNSRLDDHINDDVRHITQAERTFWNNKLNCSISGDELVINHN